jgi:enoyl-CoA hydratase/carnithine racemase
MNRLTRQLVDDLSEKLNQLACDPHPLIITGNRGFFSAGADLDEIAALTGSRAYEFSSVGQALMNSVAHFPAPVYAAVSGYCMGGGLDLALACHRRIASQNAVFGHRGAALGLVTGWGGTQRLPRLVGKTRALQMFIAAAKIEAQEAFQIGLVDAIADDPLVEAARRITLSRQKPGVPV